MKRLSDFTLIMKRLCSLPLCFTLFLSGFILTGISGCAGHAANAVAGSVADTPADSLYHQLIKIYTRGAVMLGHDDDPVYGHSWNGDFGRSDILETVGDFPAMMSWDLGGIEQGWDKNLDSVPFTRIKDEVRRQHARGGFNTFSWHLFNPVDGGDAWTIGDSLTVKKIVADDAVNARFREQVRSVARFFNSLQDDKGNKIPVIFRPLHENSGHWFWWGKPYASPQEYVALWKIIREEFDKAGVDNVLYAYSPDRIYSEEEYLEYYPGDELVDILGIDIYLFNGKEGIEEYRNTAVNALQIIRRLSGERNKIPAFTETGSESVPVADWWTEVLLPLLKEHPVAYFVLWRNAHDKPEHHYAPYPGHPSEANFKEFCNDSSILLIKDL